ncbi:MAG: adenylate/guanylate cyclase domain-containing protein [Rhizobiaceae bacterium]
MKSKFAVIWIFGLTAAAVIWAIAITGNGFDRLNTQVFDQYQQIKPRAWGNSDITIVDIDEASIKRIGQWPWPRTVVADLTNNLGKMGAAAIIFDIVFAEADRTSPLKAIEGLTRAGAQINLPNKIDMLDNDIVLAEAFSHNTVVTGMILSAQGADTPPAPKAGTGFSGTPPPHLMGGEIKSIRNLEILDKAATGIGIFNFFTHDQQDSVVRKAVLMHGANDQYYPSLVMEALRVVQGAGSFKIKSSDGSGELSGGQLSVVSVKVGALQVPTDANGAIDIYHSPADQKPTLSAKDILYPDEHGLPKNTLENNIANHIILIGTSAAGLLDLRATPLESVVPGVTIHAEIIDQILVGTYLSRPDLALGIELLVAIIAVFLLLALLPILNSVGDALAAAVLSALVIWAFWYAFSQHRLLLSPILPVFSILAAYALGVAADLLIAEKEGRFVRNAFSHYLSPAMVKRLAENPDSLALGGEEKELTVLFCDIRGFTSLSEGLGPTELTELLNNFLTPMTTALLERGATIDKYMGDAIMAFWNAPMDQADHAQRACEGLLDMRNALVKLNQTTNHPISIGIGLNTGACCVGNLGSTQRFNYSAIGDAVNVASRIEGLTKQYGLDNLVAAETLQVTEGFATLEIDRVGVVGREAPLTVFTLLGGIDTLKNPTFQKLLKAHGEMIDDYQSGDAENGLVNMTKANRLAEKLGGLSLLKVYALYGERFFELRETGVPKDWDGVFRATTK